VDGPLWRFRRFEPQRRKGRKGKEKKKTFALLASWRFQDSNRKGEEKKRNWEFIFEEAI